MAKIVLGNWPD